jgi:hypothetical protein
MKSILTVILFLYLIPNTKAGFIEVLHPLGFEIDTVINLSVESIMLAQIDSLNKQYAKADEAYGCFPKVYQRALFRDLPGIRYYSLVGCNNYSGIHVTRFDYVLFNKDNQAIYYPDGDLKAFNAVFSDAIRQNYRPYFLLKLLSLYLSAIDPKRPYLMLGDYNDVRFIYDCMSDDSFSGLLLQEIEWVKELYPLRDSTIAIKKYQDSIRFEINTFDTDHSIDYWIFNIYTDSISLISKTLIESDVNLESKRDSLWRARGLDQAK